MKYKLISLLILFFTTSSVLASEEPTQVVEGFLSGLMHGDAEAAASQYMQPKVREIMGDNFSKLLVQIKAYSDSFGGFENLALLHKEKLSSRLYRFVYIAHTVSLPIAYEIFVYSSNGEWKVTSFKFDTDMEVVFPALK